MAKYDFTNSLSPLDFELLSKDLLEAELGISLENFSEGRDKGIDLRYAPVSGSGSPLNGTDNSQQSTIVQCKRYSKFSDLKASLKRSEVDKVRKLNPDRYILVTSVSLSPQQVDELQALLLPYVKSTNDIYGRERLNSILGKHGEIERRHIKLWCTSTGVLETLINSGTHVVSREEVERTIAAAKLYVRNPSFDEALEILHKHRVCIISGQPGIGKTTLARMLLLYFQDKKFDVVKIESDISEARAVSYHNRPRFYYYDDFLGQTAQADKLNKNEDQKLLDFMASVRDSKDSVMVLTTREYILNQAKLHYEKLDRVAFDHQTCVIDLSKYSRRIRAEILYNHIHFSDLPHEYQEALIAERAYLKIIDHKNYNPRLIECLTSLTWIGSTSPKEYIQYFLGHLDNPSAIWEHAFRNQISDAARHLMFVLTTLPTKVVREHLEHAFEAFHSAQCSRYGVPHSCADFKKALKELDGTFVNTSRDGELLLVAFQNPSIRDFMQNVLLSGESLKEVVSALVYFEQAEWFSKVLNEEKAHVPMSLLKNHATSIIDRMKTLFNSPGCGPSLGWWHTLNPAVNKADRLAQLVETLKHVDAAKQVQFIESQIETLAKQLLTGGITTASCIRASEALSSMGFLSSEYGRKFITALKITALNNPSDCDDFETLASVIESFPEVFSPAEIETVQSTYQDFAYEYADDLVSGNLGIDDPEELRHEAGKVEEIGEYLGVDISEAKEMIVDFAAKKEFDETDSWSPDEEPVNVRGTQDCSDSEIDSLFGTLKA
ncbi:hypothetical protein FEF65_03345 [Mariprofundus erugo]|uniref:Uncharacterized protein n=1 Tax=Mariprofundus erugo TaxID=2528639 RepID=A0A5R9H1N2_9PROT|nr:restriction endonuclease [Mariprofundus erugo]TLS68744.1 hypothetical protein FEF65_03345 [Mariprofundus erugo]